MVHLGFGSDKGEVIKIVRGHLLFLYFSILKIFVAAFFCFLLLNFLSEIYEVDYVYYVFILALFFCLVYKIWIWSMNYCIITTTRIVVSRCLGLFERTTKFVSLEAVQETTVEVDGLLAKLFNFGDIIIRIVDGGGTLTLKKYIVQRKLVQLYQILGENKLYEDT